MWVSKLSLRDFRSFGSLDLDLSPGVTTFVAPNGSGKTNLVEALGYLSTLRSHRVSQDLPLVAHERPEATVSALAHRGPRQVTVEVVIKARGANRARINRQPVRTRELLGLLPSVVFAPEDLALIKGEPADRRDFIDALLIARQPRYAGVLADLDRALRQRNALLKSLRTSPDPGLEATLDIWDQAFAESAGQLVVGRRAVLGDLQEPLAEAFAYIAAEARSERRQAAVEYSSRIDYSGVGTAEEAQEAVIEALQRRRRPEIERGLTLVGPQRDDLLLSIGGVQAKGYASHGESWSLALALRLAAWELQRGDSEDPAEQPVLVLDDVFAELDAGRRRRLAAKVAEAEQVLITAAVGSDVPQNLSGAVVQLMDIHPLDTDMDAAESVESSSGEPLADTVTAEADHER